MHCLILRGVGRTVIRRWSPDTRLNGRSFADAPLTPGDRLRIGPIELQVLESDRFGQPPSRAVADDRDTRLQAEKQALQDSRRELQRQQRQWQAERKETEKRLGERTQELEARWAELDSRQEALEAQRSPWDAQRAKTPPQPAETAKRIEEGDSRMAELDARSEELKRQQRRWQAEREEAEKRLGERTQELERQQRQWQAKREEAEKRLGQRTKELEARLADLHAQRESFRQERHQWEVRQAEQQQQLGRRAEELDARQAELEARPAAIESEHVDPAAASQPLPQPEAESAAEEPAKGKPDQLDEVFQRMGAIGLLRDGESPAEPAVEPEPEDTEPEDTTPAEDGGEESIENYMSRLMDRVRSTTGPPAPRRPDPPSPAAEEFTTTENTTTEDRTTQSPASEPATPADLPPLAVAPEREGGLSAMRELANLSAHAAIDRHSQQRILRAKRVSLLTAVLTLLLGGIALGTWATQDVGQLVLHGGLGSLFVALISGLRYVVVSTRLTAGEQDDSGLEPGEGDRSETPG